MDLRFCHTQSAGIGRDAKDPQSTARQPSAWHTVAQLRWATGQSADLESRNGAHLTGERSARKVWKTKANHAARPSGFFDHDAVVLAQQKPRP